MATCRAAIVPIDQPLKAARQEFERQYFEHHLTAQKWQIGQVAEIAGIGNSYLYEKLRQLGLIK